MLWLIVGHLGDQSGGKRNETESANNVADKSRSTSVPASAGGTPVSQDDYLVVTPLSRNAANPAMSSSKAVSEDGKVVLTMFSQRTNIGTDAQVSILDKDSGLEEWFKLEPLRFVRNVYVSPDKDRAIVEYSVSNWGFDFAVFQRQSNGSYRFVPGSHAAKAGEFLAAIKATPVKDFHRLSVNVTDLSENPESVHVTLTGSYMKKSGSMNEQIPFGPVAARWMFESPAGKIVNPFNYRQVAGWELDKDRNAEFERKAMQLREQALRQNPNPPAATPLPTVALRQNPNPLSATPSPAVAGILPGERYPQTRMRLLRPEELQNLTAVDLRYAINEMYARRGADFRDRDLRQAFARFSWYRPRTGNSFEQTEAFFTPLETDNLKLLGQFRDARKGGVNPVATPLPVALRSMATPIPFAATPAPPATIPIGPRYTGNGRVYKVPELKGLVDQKLNNAWLYGDFILKGTEGNTGYFITTAIVLLPKEGSTQVQVEFPGGIQLSPAAVNTLRDPMLVIPVAFWAKDPVQLLSVSRMSNGKLLVKARARGVLRL